MADQKIEIILLETNDLREIKVEFQDETNLNLEIKLELQINRIKYKPAKIPFISAFQPNQYVFPNSVKVSIHNETEMHANNKLKDRYKQLLSLLIIGAYEKEGEKREKTK